MQKIQNFQTFSQLKTQLKEQAVKKEMATKREATVTEYNELLSKYNVSKITELSEKDRAIFLAELTQESTLTEGKKVFRVNPGIGKAKYSISSHDGVKKHKDGSDFFDIEIFNNKVDLEKGIKKYTSDGFVKESVESVVTEAGSFAGWIAIFNGKKLEIDKSEADGIYNAKLLAIKKLNVPKSKLGLLSISPAVDESVVTEGFKHIIYVETPTEIVSKPIAAQILALAKKGVRSKEIGLEMGFVGNAKLATDAFQKVKNQIYFSLDKRNESVVTEAVSSKDEKSIEDFIKSAIGKKVKLTTKEFDGESDVEDKFTKASWGNNVYKVDYMSIDFDQELDAIKRGSGKILKLDKNTFKWNVDGPKGTDITIEIK